MNVETFWNKLIFPKIAHIYTLTCPNTTENCWYELKYFHEYFKRKTCQSMLKAACNKFCRHFLVTKIYIFLCVSSALSTSYMNTLVECMLPFWWPSSTQRLMCQSLIPLVVKVHTKGNTWKKFCFNFISTLYDNTRSIKCSTFLSCKKSNNSWLESSSSKDQVMS